MNFLIVDDEPFVLNDFQEMLLKALDKMGIVDYRILKATNEREALREANEYRIDAAFLDIHLSGGSNGIALAKKLQEIYPKINLIFTTAYKEHIFDALPLHFSGYLMKPIGTKEICDELKCLRFGPDIVTENQFYVRCFGDFEVYNGDKPIHFTRLKTKELFAFLIDRKGAAANVNQICAAIFEKFDSDSSHKTTVRILAMELKKILEDAGFGDAYIHERNSYAIIPDRIPCDLYRYESGERNLYRGKYMDQYSYWAWFKE